jgi:serine/threonine-protein kinase
VQDALALLERARGTASETAALSALLSTPGPLPEPLALAAAQILVLRGDDARALDLLAQARSVPALMMVADLEAQRGNVAAAVGAVERVLAKSIDAPGARERHERWVQALGIGERPAPRTDESTIVAPSRTDTPFRILREVARGGAGSVYEAEDELLGRRVAFKVYHGEAADRALVEREARLAARLAGPGVVRVLDAAPEQGWIALEWAPLGSMRDLLRSVRRHLLEPISVWAVPLARALARVHDAGLVHGDVKPANVLFRTPDDPILTDFGIARPVGAPSAGGSAGYVAPERLVGRMASPSDDVYGFGRVVEDVLDGMPDADEASAVTALVAACLAPVDRRPPDGSSLVALVLGARTDRRIG